MIKGRKFAVFTMDLEDLTDTGCIRESDLDLHEDMLDGLDEYVKLLDKHSIKATLFAVNDAALKVKDKLKEYIKSGHDLALHGYDHAAPITLDKEEFREKIRLAKNKLEETFGVNIAGYRAPYFSLDNSRLEVLRELGFTYDSSKFDFPKRTYAAQIDTTDFKKVAENIYHRSGFYEFGVPLKKFMGIRVPVSGGGYVRMGDWGFCASMLYNYLSNNNYYVFYLHPFELSKVRMPRTPKLKSYDKYYLRAGIKSYPRKIEKIIKMLKKQGYEFITFSDLAKRLEAGEKMFE
jgi:peptidoglycan/xylan/chitin deacetylase (PgdA/CDA1 family)